MSNFQKFKMYSISKIEQRYIIGGGGASAKCLDGSTVRCSGKSCISTDQRDTSHDGGCQCTTANGDFDWRPCPVIAP